MNDDRHPAPVVTVLSGLWAAALTAGSHSLMTGTVFVAFTVLWWLPTLLIGIGLLRAGTAAHLVHVLLFYAACFMAFAMFPFALAIPSIGLAIGASRARVRRCAAATALGHRQ